MRNATLLSVFAFLALSGIASAQAQISSFTVLQNWLPVIMIAVMLSISIVGIYYILGYLLNNKRVKSAALSELGQAVGTAIIVIAIIAVFTLIGTGQLSFVSILSPTVLSSTLCNQLDSGVSNNVHLGMLDTKSVGSVVNGAYTSSSFADTICHNVRSLAAGTSGADITPQIDYGLFYSYLVIDNLTNQAANNLDSFYVFSGWIGFLSSFKQFTAFCMSKVGPFGVCAIPVFGLPATTLEVAYKSVPYAGYSSISDMIKPTQLESVLTFYIMLLQLQIIQLFLAIWPYLLAAGIILRSTFFTRGVGGLLMAMSISVVLIFPVMYGMEYSAFSSGYIGGASGIGPIGASNLPTMPLYELNNGARTVYGVNPTGYGGYADASLVPNSGCDAGQLVHENVCGYSGTADENPQCTASGSSGPLCCAPGAVASTGGCIMPPGININFFVLPDASRVLSYYHCMPNGPGGLVGSEAAFAAFYLIPGVGAVTGVLGVLTGSVPATPLDWPLNGCTPTRAIDAALAVTNLYGITFAAGVLFPIINILVALAAMTGLSTLFGGDTDILGLSKLI